MRRAAPDSRTALSGSFAWNQAHGLTCGNIAQVAVTLMRAARIRRPYLRLRGVPATPSRTCESSPSPSRCGPAASQHGAAARSTTDLGRWCGHYGGTRASVGGCGPRQATPHPEALPTSTRPAHRYQPHGRVHLTRLGPCAPPENARAASQDLGGGSSSLTAVYCTNVRDTSVQTTLS
jgi:hypothetical protein